MSKGEGEMLASLAFSSVLPRCLADRTSWPRLPRREGRGGHGIPWRGTGRQGRPRTETTARNTSSQGQTQTLGTARLISKQGGVMGTGRGPVPSVHIPALAWHENDPKSSKQDTPKLWVGRWVAMLCRCSRCSETNNVFPSLRSSSCWYQFDLDTQSCPTLCNIGL